MRGTNISSMAAILLALGAVGSAWAALPAPEVSGSLVQLGSPVPLLWTPTAEVRVGSPREVPPLDLALTGDTYGPVYVLRAPTDGIVEYLYSWTGFFLVGQPLVRVYDSKLLADLRAAKAAGKFDARPFIIAATARASVWDVPFPSPTTQPVAPGTVLRPAAPETENSTVERPRATLERRETAANVSRARLTMARQELAVAEKHLAETQEELVARRQLQKSGVLVPEEVTRFETQHVQAQAAVKAAREKLREAEKAGKAENAEPSAPTRVPPLRPVAPMALPALPAIPPPPAELQRLSAPRWQDSLAPTGGLVLKPLQPPGAAVKKGTPLLKVANSAWARLRVLVPPEQSFRFHRSAPVAVAFPELPGLEFVGWVTSKHLLPGDERGVVEMLVTNARQPFETQALLMSLAYASPPLQDSSEAELAPDISRVAAALAPSERLFALVPAAVMTSAAKARAEEYNGLPLTGRLAVVPPIPRFGPPECPDPELRERLTQLHEWQESFIEGLTTAIYGQRIVLSYPREGAISAAVERMLKSEVSHDPGYCARTLREALGWGLGDAYQWATRLPEHGYLPREDGIPRPGDIMVWPFTYGSHHSQHIGVAVLQNGRLMLLSNLEGRLGTSEIVGGYIAFYKPATPGVSVPSSAPRAGRPARP